MRRSLTIIFVACFAAVLMAGCGSNPPSAPGMPTQTLLRLKGNPGDTAKVTFLVDTHLSLPGDGKGGGPTSAEMTMKLVQEHKIDKVEDGKIHWTYTNLEVNADGSGVLAMQANQLKGSEKGKKEEVVRNERNEVVETRGETPLQLIFPEEAVHVGDQWRGETELQGQKMMMLYTVDAFEKVGGKTAVKISASLEGSRDITLTKPLTVWYDVSNGWPIKGSGEFTLEPQPGTKLTLTMKMEAE